MNTVDGLPIQYDRAPRNCRDTLERYIEHRIPMGSFLTAFASNDLFDAMSRADDVNRLQFFELCSWFYNYAPPMCYGSPEKVANWLNPNQETGV